MTIHWLGAPSLHILVVTMSSIDEFCWLRFILDFKRDRRSICDRHIFKLYWMYFRQVWWTARFYPYWISILEILSSRMPAVSVRFSGMPQTFPEAYYLTFLLLTNYFCWYKSMFDLNLICFRSLNYIWTRLSNIPLSYSTNSVH